MSFIICATGIYKSYVGNGTYIVDGEKYAAFVDILKAKKYSSRERAESAANRLSESCRNLKTYEVIEIND